MNISDIKIYKPLWWLIHIVAIPSVFWLGHFLQFKPR